MSRNGFMLKGRVASNGYDWWWHSFVAVNKKTGRHRPFFIEYFVINPALGTDRPVIVKRGHENGVKPAYAMIKAGTWGKDATQINNFFSIKDFSASYDEMNVEIKDNIATETRIKGSVFMPQKEAKNHPEYMSDSGKMSWDIAAKKLISYSVGYGASKAFRMLNAFRMFWHIEGMKTEYSGKVLFGNEEYVVLPKNCFGYQDKNWGSDYTNPWIWLNCNNIKMKGNGRELKMTGLVAGGGTPVIFGIPLKRKIVVAFYHEGKVYEFNFSKFWQGNRQEVSCEEDKKFLYWNITAWNRQNKIEISFRCEKRKMFF